MVGQREAVVVLDIEDAQEMCKGCERFQETPLVDIRRRSRGREVRRSSSCTARRSARARPEEPAESTCSAGTCSSARCSSLQACVLCTFRCSESTDGQPCAACTCGLRVFQQNTFLTVAEEEDHDFPKVPLRRTQSM
ncbi:unnamed protein product [Effrenium voratum]|nr:unnamed protein product [Effrenium voratum]